MHCGRCGMFVSVPDQELVLIDRGRLIARYPISTSKFGLGDGTGTTERRSARFSSPENSAII